MLNPILIVTNLRQIGRILWVRVAVFAALSLLAALSAPVLDPFLPQASKDRFSDEAVLPVLNILASGMLAVATFSLGVMVSSHRTLAGNTTPRIHRLLMEDTSTQSMLATFIGAFVFSLVSIILFRADYYGPGAAVVVFAVTVFVVAAIVVSLIRWIHKLSRIGSVDYALERAEGTARETLNLHRKHPTLDAARLDGPQAVPDGAAPVLAPQSGFLRRIDVAALHSAADAAEGCVYVTVLPGDRVLSGEELARATGDVDPARLADAFTLGAARSYEQDARYALQALRETASRALSPGTNDPGTAVEVITRLEILLHDFFCADPGEDAPRYDRVFIRYLRPRDLVETAFRDIVRDGAGFVGVLGAVSVALATMERNGDGATQEAVRDLRDELRAHSETGLRTGAERDRLARLMARAGRGWQDDDG